MKVDLSDREKKRLEQAVKTNPFHQYLKNLPNMSFEVGDVLIKKVSRYNHKDPANPLWTAEPISSSNNMPQRYVFIFKDEFGIGYVKQLKVSTGELGKDLYCLTSFDYSGTRFEVDPEYAETTLLDSSFDIKHLHTKSLEQRKIISKINRKSGVKLLKLKECNGFFSGMKTGDKFWITSDYTARWTREFQIVKLETVSVAALNNMYDYGWSGYKNKFKDSSGNVSLNDTDVIKVYYSEVSSSGVRVQYSYDVAGYGKSVLFKQKPAQEEK